MSLRSFFRVTAVFLGAVLSASVAAAIPTSEHDALVAIYTATDGPHWTDSTGWNGAAGTECSWFGITCDEAETMVLDIQLGDNKLSGTLPSLSALTHLRGFVVYTNALTGPIPPLASLKSLVFFDVNTNQLSGSVPQLTGLTLLSYVDIDSNQLGGALPALSGLTALQYFDAHSNQFVGSIPALAGLTSLQNINLSSNQLSGTIPVLSGLSALQRFDFSTNQLTGPLPLLQNLPALQNFSVGQNQLSSTIPSFSSLPATVAYIDISYNNFSGTIPALTGLPALIAFSASGNQFTGPLPALTGLTALQYFDANYNSLSGPMPALSGLSSLRNFSIEGNQVNGAIPTLSGLANLEQLVIDNNQLVGTIPSLSGLTNLQGLYAGTNQLTGLIPSLAGLTNLQRFYVDANQLEGPVPALSGLNQLQYFSVSGNKLTGTLPDLAGHTEIISFDASYNQLSGPIPALAGLANLQTLYLGFNKLEGSIPALNGLTALQIFVVDDNQLSGPIPALGGLTNLQSFVAGNNALNGSIPALNGLTALTEFSVGMNALGGTLPALSGLNNLVYFDASYNSIGGSIPSLAGLTSLQQFFVGFNKLDGQIPSLAGLSNLQYFAVDDNQLNGPLPTLVGVNNLIVFLAASNSLEGTIPPLTGLSNLQYFDVGNNRLSGAIPSVPAPDGLVTGLSTLCPNNLVPSVNPGWDDATGLSPWYTTCSSNESQEANGSPTTKDSTQIAFSSDGSIEVFQSQQTDLTSNNGNAGGQDVYSFGADGQTVLESIDSTGTKLAGTASLPAVSPDGNVIAFLYTPLAAKDKKDFVNGQIWAGGRGQPKHRVDVGMSGVPADGSAASAPSLSSANGANQLVFCSAATNLVPNDANGGHDIFIADPLNSSGALQRVSVDGTGKELPGDSCEPKLSSDGSKLVFSVSAAPLFGTAARQIVLKELSAGKVLLTGQFLPITTNAGGQGASADSSEPVISQDGSVVAFTSTADLDGIGAPVGGKEVFVSLKQPSGRLIKRARSGDGTVPDGASQHPQISNDGTAVVMQTAAKNFLTPKLLSKDASSVSPQCGAVAITTNFFSVNALGGPLCTSDGKTLNQNPAISGDGTTSGFDSNASQGNGSSNRNAFAQGIGTTTGITTLPSNLSGDLSGQWFDPSQNGQGLVLDVVKPDANNNRLLLLTWFVFANGQPTWVQGAGTARAGTGTGANTVIVQMDEVDIYQGKSFPLGEAAATATLWGSITLTFTDANTGKMSWRTSYPGFSSGSMPIKHFIAVSLPQDDAAGSGIKSCYSGNWFNPTQNGHGFEFEVLPTSPAYLAVDWFAYAPNGSPVWLQGVGQISGNSAQMHLQLIDGPGAQFPPNYNPATIVQHDWGSATFTFSDSAHGSVTWSSTIAGYGSGTQPLQPIITGLMDRRSCN